MSEMRARPLLLIASSTLSAAFVLTGCGGKKTATPATSASPTTSGATSIRADLGRLRGARVRSGPQPLTIAGARAFKVVYTTASAPNPVTGKRVTLQVDRYYLSHAGKEAIVDLGTPVGVDNVDAYRLMIESYRWR